MAENSAGSGVGQGRDVWTVRQMEKGPAAARDDFLDMVLVLVPAVVMQVAGEGDGNAVVEHSFERVRATVPHVATLEEAFDALAGLIVNVEIKCFPTEPDADPDTSRNALSA